MASTQPVSLMPLVYISVWKQYLFPPLSKNWYFSPSCDTSFFDSHCGLLSLILPYFAFILPFYFHFPHFLSPSLLFSLSSFLFYIFPLFLFTLSYFFPQMTLVDISPWRGGGNIFQ